MERSLPPTFKRLSPTLGQLPPTWPTLPPLRTNWVVFHGGFYANPPIFQAG
ncbi:hypothetical protein QTL97_14910 [Sporosarcina thermotolerans]|uniref:Uncharacterized protein n=1 Tax=Sporosarcina thermotolerans TaxID=633404 RepID=A0AAW9AEZ8_9BACL|nr:hypothetical protein [Sporosarcina thermotolerans]MDW0118221.1 hypothetical protein [Sporosarcina thermotolerans]